MQQTNFLLAAAAIIPLLALALLLELRAFEMPSSPPPPSFAPRVRTLKSLAFAVFLWVAGITCYGEWVCLRSLELNRLVGGGTSLVWTAIINLAGSVLIQLAIRVLF